MGKRCSVCATLTHLTVFAAMNNCRAELGESVPLIEAVEMGKVSG